MPAELGEELGSTDARVDRALGRLRALGLVSRLSGRSRRYTAVEPDAALESLVRARAAELEAVRTSAVQLSSVYHSVQRADGHSGGIELLDDPQEFGRWFVRLQHQVREEMLVLDRPPYALAASNPVEPVSLAHGVAPTGALTSAPGWGRPWIDVDGMALSRAGPPSVTASPAAAEACSLRSVP